MSFLALTNLSLGFPVRPRCGEALLLKIPSRQAGIQCAGTVLTILQAETPQQIATARELMVEHAASLELDLCFQNFEDELQSLPGQYAPPGGRILLAYRKGQPAGVIALRPAGEAGACEMKRFFVRPGFRGHCLGRLLATRLIAEAGAMGYRRMRLDTIQGKMDQAIALYRELGFREIPAYYPTPVAETLFMELELAREATGG